MAKRENQSSKEVQRNIEISETVAEGDYANLVMIAHSPEEFILDFIRIMPGVNTARVKSRVIVTPQHAKRFLRALSDNISRYENNYGPIAERASRDHPIQFGGGTVGEA